MSGFSLSPSLGAMAARNAVINGGMAVSQEIGTTGATLTNNTAKYILDMVEAMYNHGAATAVVTSAQITAASFGAVLPGFTNAHQIKATTAISSPANGDFAKHRVKMVGRRIASWGFGATGAVQIVVAFRLYSTVSGVALVKLSNNDQSRCYYHEITVAAGNNYFAFFVPGDTSGTWQTGNLVGLTLEVFVSGKETTPASSLDAWGATNKVQSTNSTNLLGTANNLTQLTGVYVNAGSALPLATDLPGLILPYDDALMLARDYWRKTFSYSVAPADGTNDYNGVFYSAVPAGVDPHVMWAFGRSMNDVPAVTLYNPRSAGTAGQWTTAFADTANARGVQFTEFGGRFDNSGVAAAGTWHLHAVANARL